MQKGKISSLFFLFLDLLLPSNLSSCNLHSTFPFSSSAPSNEPRTVATKLVRVCTFSFSPFNSLPRHSSQFDQATLILHLRKQWCRQRTQRELYIQVSLHARGFWEERIGCLLSIFSRPSLNLLTAIRLTHHYHIAITSFFMTDQRLSFHRSVM